MRFIVAESAKLPWSLTFMSPPAIKDSDNVDTFTWKVPAPWNAAKSVVINGWVPDKGDAVKE